MMKTNVLLLCATLAGLLVASGTGRPETLPEPLWQDPGDSDAMSVRFASFNLALNRKQSGQLVAELESGQSPQAARLAEVIQRTDPDVILLNEIDYDPQGRSVSLFCEKFLQVSQNGQKPVHYPHVFTGPVNTGVDSGMDLNQDGRLALPDDGFGFGAFPGQYGMAVLSKYPVVRDEIRTFRKFLWKDMPGACKPLRADGTAWYPEEVWQRLRLSSKSHWDVPVRIGGHTVHLIGSHPTPPVFDGPEDRNGCRNHDEIRLVADYVSDRAGYLYDDKGVSGGLPPGTPFVIVGDLNADPLDGDSRQAAARLLTESPSINHSRVPRSAGGLAAAAASGQKNREHKGDAAFDTGDFNDQYTGNLRIDYCLPSAGLMIVDSGVFWPGPDEPGHELNQASDHHLVWVDVQLQ
jgi:endonuclease/exonuclease/phosphatase family metal-dependent hydrolase